MVQSLLNVMGGSLKGLHHRLNSVQKDVEEGAASTSLLSQKICSKMQRLENHLEERLAEVIGEVASAIELPPTIHHHHGPTIHNYGSLHVDQMAGYIHNVQSSPCRERSIVMVQDES